jgi:hypothetical protein
MSFLIFFAGMCLRSGIKNVAQSHVVSMVNWEVYLADMAKAARGARKGMDFVHALQEVKNFLSFCLSHKAAAA